MEKIKIVLVDDHNIVRDGLKHLLMNLSDLEVIAEAANENELFNLLLKIKPDILLMDITMCKMSGISIIKNICHDYPQIKVIILSANSDDNFVFDSFNAGALGYLPKNIQFEELVEAIKSVYKGKEYIAKSIVDVLLKKYFNRIFLSSDKKFSNVKELSRREVQVIELLAEGFSNKEIADQLIISIQTVESYKKNILEKFELNSINDLIKYAVKQFLVKI
ncbi:MAG: response regulator [Bacteroidales bacterium]